MREHSAERFFRYVSFTFDADCWLWTGVRDRAGYGKFHVGGKRIGSHRWLYQQLRGEIGTGLECDHLCRVRHCVNPDHIQLISKGDNVRRGNGITAQNARKTHCLNGHSLVEARLSKEKGGIRRRCRICQRKRTQEYNAKKRFG